MHAHMHAHDIQPLIETLFKINRLKEQYTHTLADNRQPIAATNL